MQTDQMREAFAAIMGDPRMPAQDDPGYDHWLFERAYAAGMKRAIAICKWKMRARECEDAIRAEIKEKG